MLPQPADKQAWPPRRVRGLEALEANTHQEQTGTSHSVPHNMAWAKESWLREERGVQTTGKCMYAVA